MNAEMVFSPLLSGINIRHGFSTRNGGVSTGPWASLNTGYASGDIPENIRENIRRIKTIAGIKHIQTLNQVHGREVHIVCFSPESPENVYDCQSQCPEADALISSLDSVAVGVRTADCVPILVAAPNIPVVAAIHAGWRGTVAGIVTETLDRMQRLFSVSPSSLIAAIGPCIHSCCYSVGEEVADLLRVVDEDAVIIRDNRIYADLVVANMRLLADFGIPAEQSDIIPDCTCCKRDKYFSYRRDGPTGRHLSFITTDR